MIVLLRNKTIANNIVRYSYFSSFFYQLSLSREFFFDYLHSCMKIFLKWHLFWHVLHSQHTIILWQFYYKNFIPRVAINFARRLNTERGFILLIFREKYISKALQFKDSLLTQRTPRILILKRSCKKDR